VSVPQLLPLASDVGNPTVNILIFALFVAATLAIVLRASRNNKTAADYYAAGRNFTGPQNGIAISGDYLSAASFLGIAGAIATNGYDGFLYSIGFLVAWLVALLLVAELIRNTGRFTMADVLSFRLKERPVRMAGFCPGSCSGRASVSMRTSNARGRRVCMTASGEGYRKPVPRTWPSHRETIAGGLQASEVLRRDCVV